MGKVVRALAWVAATMLLGCAAQNPGVTAQVQPPAPVPHTDLSPLQPLAISLGELWIIEKPRNDRAISETVPPWPGAATLITRRGAKTSECPLTHLDVHARVRGCAAAVDVVQQFNNPTTEPAEAIYSFPLPPG